MPACELRPATQYDTDAVYALICELKQAEFDHHAFRVGFNANLRDPNMRYHLALLDGEVVGRGRNDRTFDQREAPRRAPFLSARRLRAEPLPLHQGAVT